MRWSGATRSPPTCTGRALARCGAGRPWPPRPRPRPGGRPCRRCAACFGRASAPRRRRRPGRPWGGGFFRSGPVRRPSGATRSGGRVGTRRRVAGGPGPKVAGARGKRAGGGKGTRGRGARARLGGAGPTKLRLTNKNLTDSQVIKGK